MRIDILCAMRPRNTEPIFVPIKGIQYDAPGTDSNKSGQRGW
ncbi:hypothetical protein [Streptomyces sp. NPDC127084]